MERDEIRLECLKIASGRVTDPKEVLDRAAEYEKFVSGNQEGLEEKKPGKPGKTKASATPKSLD